MSSQTSHSAAAAGTVPRVPLRPLAAPEVALRHPSRSLTSRTLLRYGVRPFLVASDVATFAGATLLTGGLRGGDLLMLAVTVALLASAGVYRSRLSLSALDDLPTLVGRVLAAAAVTTCVGILVDSRLGTADLLVTAAAYAPALCLGRALSYAAVRAVRRRGLVAHPTLVLGAGRVGGQLAAALQERPEYGLTPVGFLDADPLLDEAELPVPVLGGHDALASVIVEFGVQDVVVAFGTLPGHEMVDVIRTCDRLHCEIFFVPRLFELHGAARDMDSVWGMPLVRLRRAAFRSPSWRLKRGFDVLVSATGLLLTAPLLLACALAVRLEGGPGILFRQQRVGLDERPFELLKFRTLKPVDDAESQTRWNVAHDDRLGPVGRFLRATSLDELPQLWNILAGHMSLVGPRPERPYFVSQFTASFPRYTARHRVPAGLTGWAQVHGLRGDTSIDDRARFDNYYIENWSLWADCKILLRTVGSVLRRSGG